MSKHYGGGPAFPVYCDQTDQQLFGASLRDYFAAKAMQGILSNSAKDYGLIDLAEEAYAAADAMLQEREK